jgi:putative spermidine/putrescine transport system substrate-binding protein
MMPLHINIGRITLFCLASLLVSGATFAKETLRILAWPGYADPDLVKIFEQKHHVNVEVTYITTDDAMWEKLERYPEKKFDVFAVNTAELQRYIDTGISLAINPENIKNTQHQLPRFRNLAHISGIMREGKVYAIPYTYSEMGLIYNKKKFSSPPTSFLSMWDPKYKGKVLMYNSSDHNFSLAALEAGIKNPFDIPNRDFRKLSLSLIKLRRNVLTFYQSPEEATHLFIKNNIALLYGNYGSQQVSELKKAGADIGYVIPNEGTFAWLDCWSITRDATNISLAEAWINYALSKKVSLALTQRQGLSNTLESPTRTQLSEKILWLQPVENPSKRAVLWNQIISGDLPERFK